MALIGRMHPLLIHFPIALLLAALVAEGIRTAGGNLRWHEVAVANVRAGAVFAALAVAAGWRLALAPGMDATSVLEWHRWLGTTSAALAAAAALATSIGRGHSRRAVRIYRIALVGAGTLVAVAGHLGGLMVWGADFLRP
jgi:uncharacterized membrane protein